MELRQYLQIARRWAWLLVLGLSAGAWLGYFYSSRQTPIYQSSTKVMVSQSQDSTSTYYDPYYDQQLAQNYIQIITTDPIVSAVSEKLGYPVNAGQVSTQLIENTSLFRLSVEDTDPQRAADISNGLVSELIAHNEEMQNKRYSSVESSLEAQLTQVEGQIAGIQSQIANISEESLTTQQDKVKAEIDGLENQILQVQNEINQIDPLNKSQLQEKQLKLDQLQSSLNFYQSIYLNLVATGISGTVGQTSASQSTQLQNTLSLYQQIYNNVLNSLETVRLAKLQNTPNIVQVEMAVPVDSPVSPQPINTMMIGGAVGLMLAAGIVILIEYLDETIKTPKDITDRFELPVIGYIAEMSKKMTGEGKVYVSKEPRSAITESFRSLKTAIEFTNRDNPPRTIMIASANPTEGKTTVAVNLAMVFAQSGKGVIVVDADMHRPMVHRYFGLSNKQGLTDVVKSSATIQSVIRTRKDMSLAVITSGDLPSNPSELLASDNMMRFIHQLKLMNYISIIDCPPFLVSDATELAAKVDGVVLVVQPGKTTVHTLTAALEQLDRVSAKVIGIVFNRIPRNKGYYYGGYEHYTKYYYSRRDKNYFETPQSGNGKKPTREQPVEVIETNEGNPH